MCVFMVYVRIMLMIYEFFCIVFVGFDFRLFSGVDFLWSILLCSVNRYLFLFGVGIILNLINKNYGNIDRVLFIYYLLIFNVYV